MSWSVTAVGKATAVKEKLAPQFESAKRATASNEHELKSVEIAEQLINSELAYMGNLAVTVEAGGSCSLGTSGWPATSQIKVKVEPIYGFVE